MRIINLLASVLVVVGALNWGLWGIFQFDLVAFLSGGPSTAISRIIYGLVGLGGIWKLKCMVSKASSCSTGKKGGGCC